MAEASETAFRLGRLRVELLRDAPVISSLAASVEEHADALTADPANRPAHAFLALELHRYYTAVEACLLRVERQFGGEPSGSDWQTELLRSSSLDYPGVRPAILPAEALAPLRLLLELRHFLRHAYAVELDPVKLRRVATFLEQARPGVDAGLAAFSDFLGAAVAALHGCGSSEE